MSPDLIARIKRLLVLIPYVARHEGGVPVAELIAFAGYRSEAELFEELDLLGLIGAPPLAPDDLVEIFVEDGMVQVALPQGFTRPPRLTVIEVAALLAAAEPLGKATGETLGSALGKLQAALPPGSEAALAELTRSSAIEAAPTPLWHAVLCEAIDRQVEVSVDYLAASTGKAATRTLRPRKLFLHRSRWYLAALDPVKGDERLYRLDRMGSVRLGVDRFEPETNGDDARYQRPVLFVGAETYPEVEAVYDASLARLAVEQWGPLAKENADGSVTVTARMAGESSAVSWALGLGGRVRIVRPEGWQQALERRAGQLLAAYLPAAGSGS